MSVAYHNLREWLAKIDTLGELRNIDGAEVEKEIGEITDYVGHVEDSPALIFDHIQGYPPGNRILVNALGSKKRLAFTLGIDEGDKLSLTQQVRAEIKNIKLVPVEEVADGPVAENVWEGDEVDLNTFPVPRWHELDGGKYLGTGSVVITKDPLSAWVNTGTYRGMVQGRNLLGWYMDPSKHGRVHRDSYWAEGKPCPVAVCVGTDPLMFLFSQLFFPHGISEMEAVGGYRGEGVKVIKSDLTGLPIPAEAEIVLEGECYQGDTALEGPFGEWTGYYASATSTQPVIRVRRIWHRRDPIIYGVPPMRPPSTNSFYRSVILSAFIWNALEEAGVPNVKGVWCHEAGATRMFTVIAIQQAYAGHPRQAGLIASQCNEGLRMGRYVVVVDEDIDPTDLGEVIWAMSTRTDPERSIDIIRRCFSGPLDPALPANNKHTSSRAIIDACRPYEWRAEFSPVIARVSGETVEELFRKWPALQR